MEIVVVVIGIVIVGNLNSPSRLFLCTCDVISQNYVHIMVIYSRNKNYSKHQRQSGWQREVKCHVLYNISPPQTFFMMHVSSSYFNYVY